MTKSVFNTVVHSDWPLTTDHQILLRQSLGPSKYLDQSWRISNKVFVILHLQECDKKRDGQPKNIILLAINVTGVVAKHF